MTMACGHSMGWGIRMRRRFRAAFAVGTILNSAYVWCRWCMACWRIRWPLLADAGTTWVMCWGCVRVVGQSSGEDSSHGERRTYGLGGLRSSRRWRMGRSFCWQWARSRGRRIRRFGDPTPVEGLTVTWIAALGLWINLGTALMFIAQPATMI